MIRGWVLCPLLGLLLGFTLAEGGFGDFGFIHAGLSLDAASGAFPDFFLAFGGGVALAGLGFAWLARGDAIPTREVHRGTVAGGILFGVGWALSGGCPALVLVQLGDGQLAATAVLASMFAGFHAARAAKRRFGLDGGSCGS